MHDPYRSSIACSASCNASSYLCSLMLATERLENSTDRACVVAGAERVSNHVDTTLVPFIGAHRPHDFPCHTPRGHQRNLWPSCSISAPPSHSPWQWLRFPSASTASRHRMRPTWCAAIDCLKRPNSRGRYPMCLIDAWRRHCLWQRRRLTESKPLP